MTERNAELLRTLRADLQRAADESEPLAYEQIEAYVDGTLDGVDREIVETRLADDAALRADVDDLRALRASLASAPASSPVVAFEPRPVVAPVTPSARRWLLPVGLAAAALMALAVWRVGQPPPDGPPQATGTDMPAPPAAAPVPPASPAFVIEIRDRDRVIGLTGDGRLAGIDDVSPGVATQMSTALREQRLPSSPLGAQVASPAGVLMSAETSDAAFRPLGPVATAIRDPRPTLRWTALPGARGYRVRIVDDRLQSVAESPMLTTLTWQPPAPLPAGQVLSWQVEADTPNGPRTTPAPPLPEARFAVLPPDEAARYASALGAAPSDLAAAILAAEAGLYDEAAAALTRLGEGNPGSEVVRALQRDLARRRGEG